MANGLIRKSEMKKTMFYWNAQILPISDTRPPSIPLDSFLPFYRIGFAQQSNKGSFFMLLKDLKISMLWVSTICAIFSLHN